MSTEKKSSVDAETEDLTKESTEEVNDSREGETDLDSSTDEINEVSESEESEQDSSENASETSELEEKIIALESSEKEAQEKLLRTLAEFENFKKRQEIEKANFLKYANEKTILDLLPVMDSFTMAKPQFESSDQKELKEGFLLILKQLESFFEKVGVEKIEAIDQAFDPTRHQAISSEEVEGKEADIVVKVMQDGFTLSDKVIRPAMVVVSK